MSKTFNLSVVIGAALSGSFKSTVGGALGQVKALGSAIQHMESGRADIGRFRKLKTDLEGTKAAMAAAQNEAGRLAREFKSADAESARLGKDLATAKERLAAVAAEMKGAKRPGEELKQAYAAAKAEVKSLGDAQKQAAQQAAVLGKSFSEAKTKAGALKTQAESQGVALQRLRQQMQQAGISTRNLAADQAKLGAALERARNAQAKLGTALAKQKANLDKRAQYRGQLFDAAAMGAAIAVPITQSMQFEHSLRAMGNIADLDAPKLAAIRSQLQQIGKLTNQKPGELLQGTAVLAGAGLDIGRTMAALPTIGKTATATQASIEDLSKTSFALIDNLKLSPTELPRVMDLLAKAGKEGRFELKDMAKAFPQITSALGSLKMQGVEAAATIGAALQIAMKGAGDPSEAANNFRNFLQKMTSPETVKNFGKFGVDLKKEIQGVLNRGVNPIEHFLKLIQKVTGGDKFKIGEIFQDLQVQNFLAPMLQNFDEYQRIKKVALSAHGVVDQDFANMMETSQEQVKRLGISVGHLGDAFSMGLSPTIGLVATVFDKAASAVVKFAVQFPFLTKVIGHVIVGLIGLRVATIAFGYAGTFVKGGILSLMVGLRGLQASLALTRSGMLALNATAGGSALGSVAGKAAGGSALGSVAGKAAGGSALGSVASKALTPVRAIGNAVLHPLTALRALGSGLAGLGSGAARGAGAGLRTVGSAAAGLGGLLLNPVGAIRSLGGAMLGFARLAVPAVVGGIRAIGLAMMSNPVGIGIAVIAGAALLIYKYWQPIKAFFGGLWGGFKSGFSSAFSGIGAALAPLQPVFNAVGAAINWVWNGIKSLVGWFGNLFAPANASSETLKQCASAGQVVGQVLGVVVGGAVRMLIAPFQLLGSAVQFVWNLFQNGPYQAVVNGFNQIRTWLENFSLADVGRKIIGTLVKGVKSVGSAVKGALTSALGTAEPVLPHSDAEEGPFSRLTASGRSVVETFGAGIRAAGSRALINPLGSILGTAQQMMNQPLAAAKNLIPDLAMPDMLGGARRLIGAAALAMPLALQPALALPAPLPNMALHQAPIMQTLGRRLTSPALPAMPEIGAAARWNTVNPQVPALPDLRSRASWAVTPPATPRLPELGGSVAWRSTPPAMPAIPNLGAAARWEAVSPQIPVIPDLQGRAAWNAVSPTIPGLPNLGAAARWNTVNPQVPALPDLRSRASWAVTPPATPRLPELGGSVAWGSTSPALPAIPNLGAAARWEAVSPQIPVIPDLRGRASWSATPPTIPGLPNLGAAFTGRLTSPALPAIPNLGAAARWEAVSPQIPVIPDLQGRAAWNAISPTIPGLPNLGAAARWNTINPQVPALPDLRSRASWAVTPPATPRLPELGGSVAWGSTPPAIPAIPNLGAAARWEALSPQIPALPDLQGRASWSAISPTIPGLPNLGAAFTGRLTSPAIPAIPEIGAAIREERPQPAIPAPSGNNGERFGVDSPPARGPIQITMGDIVVHAAPGTDGANIAAQVREQVRLALEEARRQLEAEQRGALYD